MAVINSYIKNAIAQLFDELESKCGVKFATFTASDLQGEKNLAAGTRKYMNDRKNNSSHGIYKYLYDPNMAFDFRFHQRLAAAPFEKTSKPWATIMFSTKQVQPLTNVLSHIYKDYIYNDGHPYELKTRRVLVPVNMAIVSNDMDKLYDTTEKIAMYFDRFINFHYTQVLTIGNEDSDNSFDYSQEVVGQAANIREVDLNKLDTEQRGTLVTSAFTFDLIYWIVKTPNTYLHLLEKIILDIKVNDSGYNQRIIIQDDSVDEQS